MSEDTYRRLHWCDPDDHNDHDDHGDHDNHDDDHDEYIFWKRIFRECVFWSVFSVTRRSRSDESHSLTDLLTDWVDVSIDFTDVTLVGDDTYRRLYWCDPDDPDENYLVMKVV